jgi:Fe(3+) dicitrate transport protein
MKLLVFNVTCLHFKAAFLGWLMISVCSAMAQQQWHVAEGTVRDVNGAPIHGISVFIPETNQGTLTDTSGFFRIRNIPISSCTIVFSGTGYIGKTLRVKPDSGFVCLPVTLEKFVRELDTIRIWSKSESLSAVQRLNDVSSTWLTCGIKNEVIRMNQVDANITLKTGRQLFAKVPGVFVYDMDGSGNQVNIATRGLDPHRSWEFNIRHNGVITNSDMYGYPASHFNPPMESIERVEIIRGTAALQYGAQFGGMLNYITREPDTARDLQFENVTTAGSYGLFSTYLALGGRSGKWSWNGYYSKRISEGYRESSQSDFNGQFLSVTYQCSPKLRLKAELGHSRYLYQLPGPLSDSMFAENPTQATRSRNWYSPDIFVPSLSLDWKPGKNTQVGATLSGVFGTRNSVQFIGFADNKDTINPLTGSYKPRQVDIDRFNSLTAEWRIRHEYRMLGYHAVIAAGMQLMHNDLHRRQLGKGTTGRDYDLTLIVPGWGRDLHFRTDNIAFFAENIIYLTPAWSVSPGIRFEHGKTDMSGTISYYDTARIPLRIRHDFPLLGIHTQYRFNPGSRLYAGIGQAYRPMIFKDVIPTSALDVIDPNLKDAHGYNLELGFNGKWHERVSLDLSIFRLSYQDRIGSLVLEDASGNAYNYKTNTGNSLTDGIELYLEALALRGKNNFGLSLFISSSWMSARYTKGSVPVKGSNVDITGNRVESAPEWITRNGVRLQYRKFRTSLQYSYVSMTWSDALNTAVPPPNGAKGPVPAYGLWDLDITVTAFRFGTLKAGVNNLLDKSYFTKRPVFYPDPGIWPSDGRAWYLSFGFRF